MKFINPDSANVCAQEKKTLNVGLKKKKEYFLLFLSQSNRHFFLANSLT